MNETERFVAWVAFWFAFGEIAVRFTAMTEIQFGWTLATFVTLRLLYDWARGVPEAQ